MARGKLAVEGLRQVQTPNATEEWMSTERTHSIARRRPSLGSAGGIRSFVGYDRTARVGAIGLIDVQSDLGVDIGMHLLGADFPVDM